MDISKGLRYHFLIMLDDLQKQAVAKWIEEGAGLSEVQRRIKDEFGISMTYMDVRFLVLDLGAQVKDRKSDEPKADEPKAAADGVAAKPMTDEDAAIPDSLGETADDGAAADDGYTPPGMDGASSVKVELDRIVRAGAMASGTVTFSDGVTGSWYLDRFGRLGLTKVSKPDYQPSRADLEEFQIALQEKLAGGA